ncbi:MAG: glycosyltransferase, partial [Pseudomonadota bacterium]|nr:glycosyltransferase [Pseudomonadota bacterium]
HTVGNPVRDEIWQVKPKSVDIDADANTNNLENPLGNTSGYKKGLNMLVVGGSLGAQILNETVPETCGVLESLSIKHQCGKGNSEGVIKAYTSVGADMSKIDVSDFIDDMAAAYEWADFVVCRAGALTVSEVAAAGRAAIFVPLPFAVDDHQTKNAQSLVKQNAALMIAQSVLKENLGQAVRQWLQHPEGCLKMGAVAKTCASTHATENVVSHVKSVVGVGD